MRDTQANAVGARGLPAQPSLEHLRKAAKDRLDAMRAASIPAKLSDAQFQLAREYGFSSWRELKIEVDRRTSADRVDPAGDWICNGGWSQRIALHIRRDEGGGMEATLDNRDSGLFGIPADDLFVEGGRLSFTVMTPPGENLNQGLYEAVWDSRAQTWRGEWTALGLRRPLDFTRGVYPPAPRVEGLEGIWDAAFRKAQARRLVFRIQTTRYGTFVKCDSPDRGEFGWPATSVTRDGRHVEIIMRTLTIRGEIGESGEEIVGELIRAEEVVPIKLVRRPPGAPAPRSETPVVEVPAAVLVGYVGEYVTSRGGIVYLALKDERLTVQYNQAGPIDLTPLSRTAFSRPELQLHLEIDLDADDSRPALTIVQGRRTLRAVRRS